MDPDKKTALFEQAQARLGRSGWRWLEEIPEGRFFIPRLDEFKKWDLNQKLARYARAFRERGIEKAIFWLEGRDGEIEEAASIQHRLAYQGFKFSDSSSSAQWIESAGSLTLRRLAAFLAACLGPLAAFFFLKDKPAAAFCLTCLSGGAAWLALDTVAFRSQIEPLGIIQASFLVPFAALLIFRRFSREALALAGLLAALALLRSRELLPVPVWEHGIRDYMDVHLGFRPRLKEIAGWFIWMHGGPLTGLAAMLGPVSTLNSFLHAHTPLPYIVSRSCAAFLLAAAAAKLLKRIQDSGGKTALAGYFGRGNFGDDWLLESKIKELNSKSSISINQLSLWRRCLPAFEGRPVHVLFLGGLLQDQSSRRSLIYYWAASCLAALWARRGVIFCCASVGPLSPFSRRLWSWTLRSKIGRRFSFELRDKDSLRLLKVLDPEARFSLLPDSAFSGEPALRFKKSRSGIGILIHGGLPGCLSWVQDFLSAMEPEKTVTLFLSDSRVDEPLARVLSRRFPGRLSMVRYGGQSAPFLSALAERQALLSFRLHGTIAALRSGVPVICPLGAGLEAFTLKTRELILPENVPAPLWTASPTAAAARLASLCTSTSPRFAELTEQLDPPETGTPALLVISKRRWYPYLSNPMFKVRSKRFLIFSMLGAAGIIFSTVRTNLGTSVESAYEQIRILVDILEHVQNSYVEKVALKDLIYGAASGMVRTLDPFSQFMPPEALNDMKIETEGEFGGIGIRVHISEDGWLTIITPLPGTPAFRAGVFPHDKIIKINGENTEGITIDKAVSKLRGKPGSKVTITISRVEKDAEGKENTLVKDVELAREVIKIQTIYSRMLQGTEGIGYMRITEFNAQTPRDVHNGLAKLSKEGMKSLILDLRFNPGGLLPSAIETVKEFVGQEKLVVYTQGRRRESRVEYRAASRAPYAEIPLVVLINEGSASGSEIVAGALKDHSRATIVGSRTFGKGSVQSVITLPDNSGLRLTTAYYYTPSGRLIHKRDFKRKKDKEETPEEGVTNVVDNSVKSGKPEDKKEKEETWGIDPDIEVKVTPETASKVLSSFDLVYFPDNRPSIPIREEFKKEVKKEEGKKEAGAKDSAAKDENKAAKEDGPLTDEVLERAILVFHPKAAPTTQKKP